MRVLILTLTLSLTTLLVHGQKIKETRTVTSFSGIEISGAVTVHMRMGDESAITVVGEKEMVDKVKTFVENDVLQVEMDKEWWDWSNDAGGIELFVTFKTVRYLEFSGACEVESKNTLRGENIEIEASGACKMDLKLDCKMLEMDLSGASKLKLSGKSQKVNIDASGACAIYAADLQTNTMNMDVSGASKAEVYVTDSLNVDASGACKVRYRGEPDVTQDVSGASSISKM